MRRFESLIKLILVAEAIGCATLVGLRLNSTATTPRLMKETHDTLTFAELTALPRQYLTDSVQKWRNLGEAYLVKGHFSTAEACFGRAVKGDPHSAELSFLHGMSLERLGQSQAAADAYRRAADSGNTELKSLALYCLGRTWLRVEQPDKAAEAFAEAGDNDARCLFQRAKLLIRDGRGDEARPFLESLLKVHSADLYVWNLMEQLAALEGDSQAALAARDWRERSERSLDLDVITTYHKAIRDRFGLNRQIESRGARTKRAQELPLTRLVSEDTRWQNVFPWLLESAAYAELQAGNTKEARALILRQVEKEDLPTAGASELLGDIENAENHADRAEKHWERAARMLPNANLHMKLAGLAQIRGDRATQRRQQGLGGLRRGMELYRENNLSEARSMLQQTTVNANAENPDLWFYLGESERLLGNPGKAKAAYTQCLKHNPDHGRALTALERLQGSAN